MGGIFISSFMNREAIYIHVFEWVFQRVRLLQFTTHLFPRRNRLRPWWSSRCSNAFPTRPSSSSAAHTPLPFRSSLRIICFTAEPPSHVATGLRKHCHRLLLTRIIVFPLPSSLGFLVERAATQSWRSKDRHLPVSQETPTYRTHKISPLGVVLYSRIYSEQLLLLWLTHGQS